MGTRMMLGQHPVFVDWVYHTLVFVAGLFILDHDRAVELLRSLVPFWKKP